jgi:carbamoyl-phosphate synthase small subunit
MKYGHRGANHPVMDNKTNKIFTISQNHSFAVDETTLPNGVDVSFTNLTDNSVEGLISEKYNIETVQFYPEFSQNEASSNQILAKWVEQLENRVTV